MRRRARRYDDDLHRGRWPPSTTRSPSPTWRPASGPGSATRRSRRRSTARLTTRLTEPPPGPHQHQPGNLLREDIDPERHRRHREHRDRCPPVGRRAEGRVRGPVPRGARPDRRDASSSSRPTGASRGARAWSRSAAALRDDRSRGARHPRSSSPSTAIRSCAKRSARWSRACRTSSIVEPLAYGEFRSSLQPRAHRPDRQRRHTGGGAEPRQAGAGHARLRPSARRRWKPAP